MSTISQKQSDRLKCDEESTNDETREKDTKLVERVRKKEIMERSVKRRRRRLLCWVRLSDIDLVLWRLMAVTILKK